MRTFSTRSDAIRKRLADRRTRRRGRRNRKTRYREPRVDNRTRSPGWLPPSLQSRVDNIATWFKRLFNRAPISECHIETVRFDTQALQNPEISGVEYQQGELAGYEVREYLLEKWRRRCAYCGKAGVPLEIEHLIPRSRGGSHRVSNLTLACTPCNQKKGNQTAAEFGYPKLQAKAKAPLKDVAAVNSIRYAIGHVIRSMGLPTAFWSGGRTKHNRVQQLDPLRIREFVITYLTAAIDPADSDSADREATGAARGEDLFWKLAGGGAVRAVWRVWQAAGADLTLFFTAPEIPKDNPNVYSKTTWRQNELWRQTVRDSHSLLRLAGNPYLLYMFTQVYLNLRELPANRAALFGDFIQVLLLREKLAVRDTEVGTVSFTPDGQQLLTALSELAWTMQTQRVQADAQEYAEGDALTVLDRAAAAALLGAQRLHRAASASLLAVNDQEVRFTHQLLQEYFTALRLRQRWETGQLTASALWPADRWWKRSGWEETAILLAGLYGQDCTPVLHWLAEANPEVAAQSIQRSGAHTPDATLEALRAAWLPRLTDLKRDPNPAARARGESCPEQRAAQRAAPG